MANRFATRPWLLAVTVGGLLMSAPLVTAPPPKVSGRAGGDTVTRMCWSQSARVTPVDRACRADWAIAWAHCKGLARARCTNSAVPCGFGPDSGYPCGLLAFLRIGGHDPCPLLRGSAYPATSAHGRRSASSLTGDETQDLTNPHATK